MSDTSGSTSQADSQSQSQAGNPDTSQSQADLKTVKDLPDWAQKEIRDARKEAADFRTKLQKIEDGNKTESEKLAARLESLEKDVAAKETAIRERDARDAIRAAARKAGAADSAVDAVYRMVKGDIEFNDDGEPTNVDDLLKDAKQIAPQLFRPANGRVDGGSGNTSKTGALDMNAAIRTMAGRGAG